MGEFILWTLTVALCIIIIAAALFLAAAITYPVVTKIRAEHQRKKNQE